MGLLSMPVSYAEAELVLDAIGALKVTNYVGVSRLDNVYCYLRCYVRSGALVFSLTSFEKTPPPESRIGAAFAFGDSGRYLFFSCGKAGELSARLYTRTQTRDLPGDTVALPAPQLYAGSDEQGDYWGFSGELPAEFLGQVMGATLQPGVAFWGNVYKFCIGEDAFGAAFGAEEAAGLPDAKSFGEFVVVPY